MARPLRRTIALDCVFHPHDMHGSVAVTPAR